MIPPLTHGAILGGVVTTPNLEAALADYQGRLGFALVEQGVLGADIAASWGCTASAGLPFATLLPASGAHCFIRLVEQPIPEGFVPTTSFGWASYEMTVKDVFAWPARIADSGFAMIGAPKEIPALPYFVAMQVHGRGREMLYFNETRANMPSVDLPFAASPMDHIFIVILAAPDRAAAVDWYCDRLGLDVGDTHSIAYSMINTAFGLPADTLSSLTMIQKGRMPIIEIDDYPAATVVRPRLAGYLPPGNALVTLAVDDLDALALEWITPPVTHAQAPYFGRYAATVVGPAGELLELVGI